MANIEFHLDLPPTPLEGDLDIDRESRDLLGDDFVEGVHRALRYSQEQILPVYNAQGRNYYIPLPSSVGPYDALQISGGGNFDLGITSNGGVEDCIISPEGGEASRAIVPPSENPNLFTGSTLCYENGEYVERVNHNPIGSYTSRSANWKIEQTQVAFGLLAAKGAGVITPKYVGKFEYEVADQFDEPQTAILMLVPSLGRRFDSKLLLPLNALRAGKAPTIGAQFAEELQPYYKAIILPRLQSIGRGLGIIHKIGLNHYQPTPGNTDALNAANNGLVPYITDWDDMTVPSSADRPRAQALDMAVAIQTSSAALTNLVRLEAIDKEAAADLALATTVSLLEGHRTDMPIKRTTPEDVVNVAAHHYDLDRSLDLIESWLA
jgi:hypothetical protein